MKNRQFTNNVTRAHGQHRRACNNNERKAGGAWQPDLQAPHQGSGAINGTSPCQSAADDGLATASTRLHVSIRGRGLCTSELRAAWLQAGIPCPAGPALVPPLSISSWQGAAACLLVLNRPAPSRYLMHGPQGSKKEPPQSTKYSAIICINALKTGTALSV